MYKQIVTPKDTKLMLQIPKEFVGQKIEVIAFPVEEEIPVEKKKKATKKKSRKELDDFYNSIRIDMSNYKFDREEANER